MGKINSKSTKADMEAYIAELEAKLKAKETEEEVVKEPIYTKPAKDKTDDSVTLVYCSDSLGYAKISNMEFNFNRYGEQFKVPRYQFDELVGKYRRWFDNGILAVAPEDYEVAAAKGISTTDEFVLDYKTPEEDNYKYVGEGYVHQDYKEGKYDILFTYKGKLAYFININETKEIDE